MGISLDGLSSGLGTTELIAALMQSAAQPQALLKAQVSSTTTEITALQSLNSKIAALAALATAAGKPAALDLFAATSSASNVSATVSTGAAAGELQVVVSALAQNQIGVSAAMAVWPSPGTITIVGHSGTPLTITPASSSLDDVAKAVNASAAGVIATKVASGADGSGNPLYRLQFSSKSTGADAAFSVYQGSTVDPAANMLTAPGAAITKAAQDASVTLWAGTSAEQVVTSSSNTFANLLPGLSVTVSAVAASPTTISVGRDATAVATKVGALVDSLNLVFSVIDNQSSNSTTTNADGTTTIKAGVFAGDSTIRDVDSKILTAATAPINGHSPSEYGISITRSGTITFDADKFTAALAADPDTVNAAVQQIASRVAAAATTASDKYDGQLTQRITGDQSSVSALGRQIADWDVRLASRKSTLERTFASMEVLLSNLKAQSSALTSQLSAFAPSSSNGS